MESSKQAAGANTGCMGTDQRDVCNTINYIAW